MNDMAMISYLQRLVVLVLRHAPHHEPQAALVEQSGLERVVSRDVSEQGQSGAAHDGVLRELDDRPADDLQAAFFYDLPLVMR